MKHQAFCQSCAMPLDAPQSYGTESDGSQSQDYCNYCYQDGKFTSNPSMEQMIELCVPHMTTAHKGMTQEAARAQMQKIFPQLKRWANA